MRKFPWFKIFPCGALALPFLLLISCSGGVGGSGEVSDLSSRGNLAAPSQQSGAPPPSLDREDLKVAAEMDAYALKKSESKPDGTVGAHFVGNLGAQDDSGSVGMQGRKARVLDPTTMQFVEFTLTSGGEDKLIKIDTVLEVSDARFQTLAKQFDICLYVARDPADAPEEVVKGSCCFGHCTDGKEWHKAQLTWDLTDDFEASDFLIPGGLPAPSGNSGSGPSLQKVDNKAVPTVVAP